MPPAELETVSTHRDQSDNVEDMTEEIGSGSLSESRDIGKTSRKDPSPEKVIKHPLEHSWTLWFFKNDKTKSWEEMQQPITTVATVEDFWALYNHIEVASKIPPGSDYSLFKEGIFPDWEDKRNQAGGRWLINLDKRQRSECLDRYWLETLFFLIGEQAEQHSHQVNGAVVNVRYKGDKLAVWLADASQEDSVVRIGKMVKERLGVDPDQTIGFNIHNEEKVRNGSSFRKKIFV